MTAGRSAQLAQPYYEYPHHKKWQQKRLELLRPEQEQRLTKRRWEVVPFVLLVVLVFTAAFAYVWMDAKIGVLGREINHIDMQITEAHTLSMRAEMEIGSLSALSRVESYAKLHLDMVYPDIRAVQYLDQQVSSLLATELSSLTENEAEPEAEPERHPLLAAWTELISGYFSGTALALSD